MHAAREVVVGLSTFGAFFTGAVAWGLQSASATVQAFSFLAGLGGGGAMGVFAGLATHLARGPAAYAPVQGDDSAWGWAEYEERQGRLGP